MADRPILFSAPMVRALLAGTKTQTRRVVKPQPYAVTLVGSGNHLFDYRSDLSDYSRVLDMKKAVTLCPYGQPGDRLWVRETWMPDPPINDEWPSTEFHGTRHGNLSLIPECYRKPWHTLFRASWDGHELVGWRPSIHMPRWASRITLEITGVRVERLGEISEGDCIAEGIQLLNGRFTFNGGLHESRSAVESYRALWESINGPGSWAANPWLWVLEFRRVEVSHG